jgi:hypothetical protein
LDRVEKIAIAAKDSIVVSAARANIAYEQNLNGHTAIKERIKRSSNSIKLDTQRLLNICLGISTGVKRLGQEQSRERKHAIERGQELVLQEKQRESALQAFVNKTNSLLIQLVQM